MAIVGIILNIVLGTLKDWWFTARGKQQQRADIIDADRAKGQAAKADAYKKMDEISTHGMSNEELDQKLDDGTF